MRILTFVVVFTVPVFPINNHAGTFAAALVPLFHYTLHTIMHGLEDSVGMVSALCLYFKWIKHTVSVPAINNRIQDAALYQPLLRGRPFSLANLVQAQYSSPFTNGLLKNSKCPLPYILSYVLGVGISQTSSDGIISTPNLWPRPKAYTCSYPKP